jgi:hypothetical protein
MPDQQEPELAEALAVLGRGVPEAVDRLLGLVYRELERIGHESLDSLNRVDERLARAVECRFLAGLNEGETSETLAVSQRTVSCDWQMARMAARGTAQ